jgi:hypothetical protein
MLTSFAIPTLAQAPWVASETNTTRHTLYPERRVAMSLRIVFAREGARFFNINPHIAVTLIGVRVSISLEIGEP